jgi:hypothetical protein
MPEAAEIETHHLVEEAHESAGNSLLKRIALTTALLASLGAVAALYAGATVNEALVLKTESARLQAEASDQWAYYQAKGVKGAVQEGMRTTWLASGKAVPEIVDQTIARYNGEQKEIEHAAREKEKERDAKSKTADDLLERHHKFANSVAILQVSIALAAVAALTRMRWIWAGSVGLGAVGAVLFVMTLASR